MVAVRAALAVDLLDGLREPLERWVVAELTGDEAATLGELTPHVLPEWRASVLLNRVVDDLLEILVHPVASGEADECETGWEQPAVGEVIDRGHEPLAREIAGNAEDHQAGRAG